MESARPTNGRYRRQDAPFIITAVNRGVGWTADPGKAPLSFGP